MECEKPICDRSRIRIRVNTFSGSYFHGCHFLITVKNIISSPNFVYGNTNRVVGILKFPDLCTIYDKVSKSKIRKFDNLTIRLVLPYTKVNSERFRGDESRASE